MPILPVRNLGGAGVNTDANPYDLPQNAFSRADNVIFDEGRAQRAPVFKNLFDPILEEVTYDNVLGSYDSNSGTFNSAAGASIYDSRFIGSYETPSGGKTLFICDKLGKVRSYPNGVLDDVTPGGTLVNNEEPWTHAQIAGISFLARKDMVPYVRTLSSDLTYKPMNAGEGAQWLATDTCAVIRSYLDYAIALNITKDNIEYPTMVKWSDSIGYGVPTETIVWDATATTNNAGENVLGEIKSPLLDGLALGSQFIIYAEDQVWLMEFTGSELVFNFRRLFNTGGIINTNCVTEVEGKHFVFGQNDIYMHDGVGIKSIADGRVRRTIYESLDRNAARRFFVSHDSQENLVYFNYVSKESRVGFRNTLFCNRAALYNYRTDTWSFMDLPNVVGGTDGEVVLTNYIYRNLSNSYNEYNTSYSAFTQATPKCLAYLSIVDDNNGLTESRIFAVDLSTQGVISLPASEEAYRPAVLERIGVDLAEPNGGIRDYKILKSVAPQIEYFDSDNTVEFKFGASDLPTQPVIWHTSFSFNPETEYKIDTKAYGRYLAYQAEFPGLSGFKFSGMDVDVAPISKR